ncbi:hypothetical protein RRG08_043438 [Elysia crispata]|uniref:Uncharacterized protein n=1 Tax=Elysia crispata TaxID=231223 RepID=A0AAE0YLE1_9GAST|nr:hypothetical protein RRG08_043438 [Elysia crispata]
MSSTIEVFSFRMCQQCNTTCSSLSKENEEKLEEREEGREEHGIHKHTLSGVIPQLMRGNVHARD